MPSEECGWTNILQRRELTTEGGPLGTDLCAQNSSSLFSNSYSTSSLLLCPVSLLRPSHPRASSPPSASLNSFISAQGTALFVFASSAICFCSRLFSWWQLWPEKKKKKAIVVKSKSWSGDLAMFCASQVSLSPHTEHLTGSQETFNTAFHMGD